MSSIIAHAGAGLAIYLCSNSWGNRQQRRVGALLPALAVSPDLDYLGVWLLGYAADPRFTHSLLFAIAVALAVHRMTSMIAFAEIRLRWLLLATMSHALLDFLVGAHPVPLFWPVNAGVTAPVGLLPSAGSLDPGNFYLWRNLLIELGVLGPTFALLVALVRRRSLRGLAAWALIIAPLWAVFVAWSVRLHR